MKDNLIDGSCLDPECATLFLNDFGEDQNFLRGKLCSTEGALGSDSIDIDSLVFHFIFLLFKLIFANCKVSSDFFVVVSKLQKRGSWF